MGVFAVQIPLKAPKAAEEDPKKAVLQWILGFRWGFRVEGLGVGGVFELYGLYIQSRLAIKAPNRTLRSMKRPRRSSAFHPDIAHRACSMLQAVGKAKAKSKAKAKAKSKAHMAASLGYASADRGVGVSSGGLGYATDMHASQLDS